ncbi:MAG: hypothetical protein K2W95_12940 [Candidatus Obscuribacterales bacterium]|nr:hypothetical protein [Candidatus Obscuribacterales bacterium]
MNIDEFSDKTSSCEPVSPIHIAAMRKLWEEIADARSNLLTQGMDHTHKSGDSQPTVISFGGKVEDTSSKQCQPTGERAPHPSGSPRHPDPRPQETPHGPKGDLPNPSGSHQIPDRPPQSHPIPTKSDVPNPRPHPAPQTNTEQTIPPPWWKIKVLSNSSGKDTPAGVGQLPTKLLERLTPFAKAMENPTKEVESRKKLFEEFKFAFAKRSLDNGDFEDFYDLLMEDETGLKHNIAKTGVDVKIVRAPGRKAGMIVEFDLKTPATPEGPDTTLMRIMRKGNGEVSAEVENRFKGRATTYHPVESKQALRELAYYLDRE